MPSARSWRDVALRRRVLPHLDVHRGRDQQRAIARDARGREQIVGQAVRHLGDEVGARRRDHDRFDAARKLDVRHVVLEARVPQVGHHRLAGERLKRRRRDEARRRVGHRNLHFDVISLQEPRELGHLVGGDAAGDAEQQTVIQALVHQAILLASRKRMPLARSNAAPR
jgi:hypothetical protein